MTITADTSFYIRPHTIENLEKSIHYVNIPINQNSQSTSVSQETIQRTLDSSRNADEIQTSTAHKSITKTKTTVTQFKKLTQKKKAEIDALILHYFNDEVQERYDKWVYVADKIYKVTNYRFRGYQIRERYNNQLDPNLDTSPIRQDEVEPLLFLINMYQKRWEEISMKLQSELKTSKRRPANAIKNWYNSNTNHFYKQVEVNGLQFSDHDSM